jgi:hypothetical protein
VSSLLQTPLRDTAYSLYRFFLEKLYDDTDTVCFAHINETDGKKNVGHGFISGADARDEGVFKQLLEYNETANIYVGMNPFKDGLRGQKLGRTEANVAKIKRLYADADVNGRESYEKLKASTKLPKPHFVLESSPGKYQFIWNVDGLTQETAKRLLKAIAQELGTDTAVTETARILRIPGFANCKYPDKPIVKIVDSLDVGPYRPEEFKLDFETFTDNAVTPRDLNNLIPKGYRYSAIISYAGKMLRLGNDIEDVIEGTLRWAHTNIAPPFNDNDVRQYALEIATKFPQGQPLGGDLLMSSSVTSSTPEQTQRAAEAATPLTITLGDDFLFEEIPPRKILISTISGNEPVIYEQSINQVFAWRGAGKTCLGLGFVRCLATGEPFLNFKSSGDLIPVLYVEGELPNSQFQERWRSIVGETRGITYMASIDKQPGHRYVSMATTDGMQKVENTLAELASKGVFIKVLMLDNISTLFNVKANDEEVWIPIQSWFTSLRSRGITVFFFHHAGKGGLSRSHSKSEDMLDVSIKLEEPEESEVGHLHSLMTFDKARAGLSEKPAEIKLHRTHSPKCSCGGNTGVFFCPGDGVQWEHVPKVSKRDLAYQMFSEGASVDKVKLDLGVAEGTVKTWKTNWNKAQQAKRDS